MAAALSWHIRSHDLALGGFYIRDYVKCTKAFFDLNRLKFAFSSSFRTFLSANPELPLAETLQWMVCNHLSNDLAISVAQHTGRPVHPLTTVLKRLEAQPAFRLLRSPSLTHC